MKLNYTKTELEKMIDRKSLWATPISFQSGGFKRNVYLTNLHTGFIRASIRYAGKDYDIMIPDDSRYSMIRNTIKNYIRHLEDC